MRGLGVSCTLFMVAFALLATAPAASADGIDIAAGDRIRLYDGPGNGGGGEFKAKVQELSGSSWVDTSPLISWQSFCLETDEYFSPGSLLRVKSVSLYAQQGGSNTNAGDKISLETAWLYNEFWSGNLVGLNTAGTALGDASNDEYLDNHVDNATHLQEAFWYLEEESLGVDNYYVTLAKAAVTNGWDTYGGVRVVTLERKVNGVWTFAQDQLVMTPVPEPGTLLLFGLGLAGVAAARRRRRRLA